MYAPGFGEGFFDWTNARLLIDTPSNLRALEFLVTQRQRLGFGNVVRFNASLASTSGMNAPFLTGQFAMVLAGQWEVKNIKRYRPNLPYGTIPLPPPAGGNRYYCRAGGNFMVFPRNAKNSRGAWEFTKFWSGLDNPQRAAEFYCWGGWLPLGPAITNTPIYQQYLQENPAFRPFLEMMPSEHVDPYPQVTYSQYFVDQLTQAEDSAMRGSLSPRQALERLKKEVENEAQSRKELGYAD
jgi:multiple sugar transport system substrate-binding protein